MIVLRCVDGHRLLWLTVGEIAKRLQPRSPACGTPRAERPRR
jgi:hypothetical protein